MINRRKASKSNSVVQGDQSTSVQNHRRKKRHRRSRWEGQNAFAVAASIFLVGYWWNYRWNANSRASTLPSESTHHKQPFNHTYRDTENDRNHLRMLLSKAGYHLRDLNDQELQTKIKELPSWDRIQELYGKKPIIFGLESCEKFQSLPNAAEHFISVAGTFNSGTNLMAQLLWQNCYMPARREKYGTAGVRWQVPWGKHTPVHNETHRQQHRAQNEKDIPADNVFPVVTVRDPYFWMDSMCRHPYSMEWVQDPNQCPKLVPTEDDPDFLKAIASFPVRIEYDGTKRMHKSMLHHLNEWYSAYINATFPRAIVRYEDLIFHPQKVTEAVCLCAGGAMVGGISKRRSKKLRRKSIPTDKEGKQQKNNDDGFQFVKESAKDNSSIHGKHKSGLLEAMIQYSRASPNHNMTKADLRFAMDELNPIFMKTFGYKYIITP